MGSRRMKRYRTAAVLGSLALGMVAAAPTVELSTGRTLARPSVADGLKGRFLHITDLHPDPHYLWKAKLQDGCHRKAKGKRKKGEDRAGYWGTPVRSVPSFVRLATPG